MPRKADPKQAATGIGRIIETDACVAEGAAWLARRDPRFATALAATGPLPLRRRSDGFPALLDAIVGQQISVAAANSVWQNLRAARATSVAGLNRCSDETLRACGLSHQKIAYARAVAGSGLRFRALRNQPTDAVIAQLTAIRGIGPWTAEIYAMFALGRADVFAPGDLALQESARLLFNLEDRPTAKSLAAMAEAWSPWKSVAARLLWAHYRVAKAREGVR